MSYVGKLRTLNPAGMAQRPGTVTAGGIPLQRHRASYGQQAGNAPPLSQRMSAGGSGMAPRQNFAPQPAYSAGRYEMPMASRYGGQPPPLPPKLPDARPQQGMPYPMGVGGLQMPNPQAFTTAPQREYAGPPSLPARMQGHDAPPPPLPPKMQSHGRPPMPSYPQAAPQGHVRPPQQGYPRPPMQSYQQSYQPSYQQSYQHPPMQAHRRPQQSQMPGRPPDMPAHFSANAAPAAVYAQRPSSSATAMGSSRPPATQSSASQQSPTEWKAVTRPFAFRNLGKDMETQMNGMYKEGKGMFKTKSPADKKHNQHIADSRKVLKEFMIGDRNHVINIDGKQAGLLSMTVPGSGHVRIQGLASLPGTKGVGRAAVEMAIRTSIESGLEGRVDLRYLPGFPKSNSHDTYASYGFVDASSTIEIDGKEHYDNRMTLSSEAAKKFLAQSNGTPPRFV